MVCSNVEMQGRYPYLIYQNRVSAESSYKKDEAGSDIHYYLQPLNNFAREVTFVYYHQADWNIGTIVSNDIVEAKISSSISETNWA